MLININKASYSVLKFLSDTQCTSLELSLDNQKGIIEYIFWHPKLQILSIPSSFVSKLNEVMSRPDWECKLITLTIKKSVNNTNSNDNPESDLKKIFNNPASLTIQNIHFIDVSYSKKLLEALFIHIDNFYSMDQLSLAESYKKNLQNEIYDENIIYEGYAIICRPGYDKNDGNSINAKIIIPGEISDFICGCYMNVDDFEINDFLGDDILKGVKGNVYYSKDAKFLSSISNVIFQGGNTLIDFHSILPNTVIILKVSCGKNNLNSYY